MYAFLMLWFWAASYAVMGFRILVISPDAVYKIVEGFSLQWSLYLSAGGFFGLFWAIRATYPNFFTGRGKWVALLPILGTLGFMGLLWPAVLTHPNLVYHGFVTVLSPNLTTYYGIGFTIIAFVDIVFYVGFVPLGVFFIQLLRRRKLGSKVMIKDLLLWIGLLLIFVGLIVDAGLHYVPVADMIVVAARALIAVGFFLFWFGYRLANYIIK